MKQTTTEKKNEKKINDLINAVDEAMRSLYNELISQKLITAENNKFHFSTSEGVFSYSAELKAKIFKIPLTQNHNEIENQN